MQFALLIHEDKNEFSRREGPEAGAYWGAWSAYVKAIAESGVQVGGAGLQSPDTATSVRLRNGKRQVQDGPYADSKEQFAGFFIIDVPSLDVALEWAAKAPNAGNGTIEVRPLLPPMNG